jgi:hypothetical protein
MLGERGFGRAPSEDLSQKIDGAPRDSSGRLGIRATLIDVLVRQPHNLLAAARWFDHAYVRKPPFTNACGDYTLLSRSDWSSLRGYPEWPIYSWHIDSVLLYQANRNGIREVFHGKHAPVYHIEHEPGSGFTPEEPEKLFARLEARGIPYLDWMKDVTPMIAQMDQARAAGKQVTYNDEEWGFADRAFPEAWVDERARSSAG